MTSAAAAPRRGPGGGSAEEALSRSHPRWSRWHRLTRFNVPSLILAFDVLALVVGVLGAEVVGRGVVGVDSPARQVAAFGAILLLLVFLGGLYRPRLSLSVLDDLPALAGRWLAAAGLAVLGQVLWTAAAGRDYAINWRFLWGALTIGLLAVAFRMIGYAAVRAVRRRGLVAHRTLIVGAGRVGSQIAEILRSHPEYGLRPVGFLDGNPWVAGTTSDLPVFGGPERLSSLVSATEVDTVVVAFSSMKESETVNLIRTCDRHSCELFVVPRLFELHHVDSDMETAWGLPLVRLRRATYRSRAWRLKRLIDVVVSAVAVLFLAPVLLLVALAVRLDGGPGVIFTQERVGVDGRQFLLMKFRSMRPSSEDESATLWNIARDDRLSRVGRILRKTSLDELPQLFNILRGEMSLVGPRPERPHFVNQFREAYPSYEARHRVPSGLTGWAQVHGLRGNTSISDRARFDNYYVENWSIWLDLKIIMRTIGAVFRGDGA